MTEEATGLDTLTDVIREHYDFGDVELPQQLVEAHQRRHRKLVVSTSAGRFLVKTYKRDPKILDALRFQHHLSDHLHKRRLPVAQIKRAKNGKGIVEVDDWALELQQFIEGEPLEVTSETLAISAGALGMFHEVCRGLPCPPRDARKWRFSEVPRATFARLFELAKTQGNEASATRNCNEIALFLHDASKALDWDARNDFETGLIHGDWHGGNLLFRDNRLVAVVDLEFAGDGCYLEDLAYGVSNLCVRTIVDTDRLSTRTNVLLDYYQLYRTLSFDEEVALYYAVGIKHVTTVSYQMSPEKGELAGYTAAEWMERLAAQCTWLAERAKEVRWGI